MTKIRVPNKGITTETSSVKNYKLFWIFTFAEKQRNITYGIKIAQNVIKVGLKPQGPVSIRFLIKK